MYCRVREPQLLPTERLLQWELPKEPPRDLADYESRVNYACHLIDSGIFYQEPSRVAKGGELLAATIPRNNPAVGVSPDTLSIFTPIYQDKARRQEPAPATWQRVHASLAQRLNYYTVEGEPLTYCKGTVSELIALRAVHHAVPSLQREAKANRRLNHDCSILINGEHKVPIEVKAASFSIRQNRTYVHLLPVSLTAWQCVAAWPRMHRALARKDSRLGNADSPRWYTNSQAKRMATQRVASMAVLANAIIKEGHQEPLTGAERDFLDIYSEAVTVRAHDFGRCVQETGRGHLNPIAPYLEQIIGRKAMADRPLYLRVPATPSFAL